MQLPVRHLLLGTFVVASVLVGCKSASTMTAGPGGGGPPRPRPTHPAHPCHANTCEITINVSGNCSDPRNITISNGDDFVSVDHPADFKWTISPNTYAFAGNGIVVQDPDEASGKQFTPKTADHPYEYVIRNANFRQNERTDLYDAYKYTINIQGCAAVDPFIRNE